MPTAVITGATRGIGLAVARKFAAQHYDIVLAARSQSDLNEAAARIRTETREAVQVLSVATDVGDPAGAAALVDAARELFGRIDVLVNNAGVAPLAPIAEMTDEDFAQLLQVNIRAVFQLTKAVWPAMAAQHGGVIVNVSSLAATDPFPGFAAYGASKAWVNLFTKAAAAEGRAVGIRVFAVAPGAVETQLLRSRFSDFPADQTLPPAAVAELIYAVTGAPFRSSSGETIQIRK